MTQIEDKLKQFAQNLDRECAHRFSPFNVANWVATNRYRQESLARVFFAIAPWVWGIAAFYCFVFGLLINWVVGSVPMFVAGGLMIAHAVYCVVDSRRTYQAMLNRSRWLIEDPEVTRFLCSEKGKAYGSLKSALIDLEAYFEGGERLYPGAVFSQLENALSDGFKRKEGPITVVDLINRFGSKAAQQEMNSRIGQLKAHYSEKGLTPKPGSLPVVKIEDMDGLPYEVSTDEPLFPRYHEIQDTLKIYTDAFVEYVLNGVANGFPRHLRWWQIRSVLSADHHHSSLFSFRSDMIFAGGLAGLAIGVVVALPTALFAPNVAVALAVGFTVLGGGDLYRRLKSSMKRGSIALEKDVSMVDLILLDRFYRELLVISSDQKELDSLDVCLSDLAENKQFGFVPEIFAIVSLHKHLNESEAKQRQFDKRCNVKCASTN